MFYWKNWQISENCLDVFDSNIKINISDNEQFGNIAIK